MPFSLKSGAAQLVPGFNIANEDSRPNVRKDGADMVFIVKSYRQRTVANGNIAHNLAEMNY
ncbi:MAG: hypothetical protein H0U50_13450 [Pyrinomonadaceae bacterium]|nr:hypothetical protein [Pyrinomonadaceae bacterium]